MKQINDKGYADKYKYDSRTLFRIAINYSTSNHRIDDYIIEHA